ncbi:MAG TPA: histidinol-phosphatase [Myxococcaceae bacterium]|nr:histidinol-phosphatase [Myxococcaceae bacterium]
MTDSLMQAVAEVAKLAGDIALGHFKQGVAVETKRDGSPVTIADRASETAARAWISARFPQDGILGEEFGLERPEAKRRWIMDPIDGTKTFIRGVPLWGTLVGVAEGEELLAGAAYFPAVGELLAAAPGQGCWWNGTRCSVSKVSELAKATVLITDDRFAANPDRWPGWRKVSEGAAISRTWGDCYGYLLVATGRAEVMADELMSPWDAAALLPIIQEAGGVFTDWKGAKTAFGGSSIATNAALDSEVRRLLGAGA